jgi:4-azaleucine resistance transporter AzlC
MSLASIKAGPVRWALKESIPVFMGYIPLGMVYGFLFVQAGAEWWMAPLASMLIYGGAAQYMMVPMLAAGLPVATIAIATLVINLRHVFYGLPLLNKFPTTPWKKWCAVFWLTDETFSQVSVLPKGTEENKIFFLAFFNYCWWVLGSLLGAIIGAQAKIELAGLDFVLTSLFAMLLCEQWRGRKTAWSVWAALISYGAARAISPEHSLAISIGFCAAAAILWGKMRKKSSGKPANSASSQGEA